MFARILLCLLFAPTLVWAEVPQPSLFLSPVESSASRNISAVTSHANIIKLDALTYYAPQRWSVWINKRKITPETNDPLIRIISINDQSATIEASTAMDTTPSVFTLQAGQSFDLTQQMTSGR
jgi:hypothetical protein